MTRKIPVVGLSLLLTLAVAASATGRQPLRTLTPAGLFHPVITRVYNLPVDSSLTNEENHRGTVENVPGSVHIEHDSSLRVVATDKPSVSSVKKLQGIATWYCLIGQSRCPYMASHGMYAAAGPALRAALGSHWRGKWVTVARGQISIRVQLLDWCQCNGGHVIDLFGDAFASLAPLSRGAVGVTVSW